MQRLAAGGAVRSELHAQSCTRGEGGVDRVGPGAVGAAEQEGPLQLQAGRDGWRGSWWDDDAGWCFWPVPINMSSPQPARAALGTQSAAARAVAAPSKRRFQVLALGRSMRVRFGGPESARHHNGTARPPEMRKSLLAVGGLSQRKSREIRPATETSAVLH